MSQALRLREARLGVPLVQRTTRSVRLTEAREQRYAAARPALDDLRAAVTAVGEFGGEPHGTLGLEASTVADILLDGRCWSAS